MKAVKIFNHDHTDKILQQITAFGKNSVWIKTLRVFSWPMPFHHITTRITSGLMPKSRNEL